MTCGWSEWINLGKPTSGPNAPEEVQCRSVLYPGLPMSEMGQTVTCNKDVGFICNNKQQGPTQQCFDYEIRLKCCDCQTHSTTVPIHPQHLPHINNTTPSTTSTTVPIHLYYFHHGNNCNTINSINNSYSLNTFEYNLLHLLHNQNTTPQPITTAPCPGGT
ncbi:hypothetical protein F7725_025899 [Dissostichus mawsoni]|uniref:WxxW domain-containing protein n=1 Tax=Dissostichus mawsoni TaxID=36200 RepID=A0A7J5X5J4_DISMA|nr:hypothetical protein F7725_025899 [Dissostichus mawsoni]